MKNLIIFLLILFIIFGAFYFYLQQQTLNQKISQIQEQTEDSSPPPNNDNALPSDNGDQGSDLITQIPTIDILDDENAIKQAFADKYNKDLSEIILTIKENTGFLASGGVKFSAEVGGGWWLAAKTDDVWQIVQDGNGTIDCDLTDPYNFPSSMVPECWSPSQNKLIKKQ